jgi:hypothetical protein
MEAVVGHRQRLGEALGFIIDRARAGRVHIAGVVLRLRVDERIAIDFAGGGKQKARVIGACNAQAVMSPRRRLSWSESEG